MSHTILYRTMFVRLADGFFIPIYEAGSNNCYDPWRNRRTRDWQHYYPCYLRHDSKSLPFFTEQELIALITRDLGHAEYCGTAISGKPNANRTDLLNYWKRGIKRAKTIAEISNAGIDLQVTDTNYGSDAKHYTQVVSNFAQLVVAWNECITQCGSAEVIPVGEVHDWQYRQLYPPKPKVVAAHDKGYVVQFGYEYVSKMTSRRLFHNGYINCAKVYTTRPAAEKVAQRIRKGFPTITNEPKVIVVNKIDGKWHPAA